MRQTTAHQLALLLLGALLFSFNLGGFDLWPADEPRFGLVAREMLQSGNFQVPTVNDEPYYEKPPLYFWFEAAVAAPFGEVTAWSARMPSVLAALLVVLLTYRLALAQYDPRTAFWAALILLTTQRFWWQARTAQLDMLLTACLMVVLYALWHWHHDRNRNWLAVIYAALTAAMFTKGPPAPVFFLLFIFVFYGGQRDTRRSLHWGIGLVGVMLLTAAWYIPARFAAADTAAQAVESGVAGNLFRNTIGRALLGVSKAQPPWYYLVNLPVDWLPWSLTIPWTIPWLWRNRRRGEAMRFNLAWTVPAFIVFSIFIGKRAIYLLPIYPALAILVARAVIALVDADRPRLRRGIAIVWGVALAAIGAASFALPFTEHAYLATCGVYGFGIVTLLLGIGALATAYLSLGVRTLHELMAATMIPLTLVVAAFVLPAVNQVKSAASITQPVREAVRAGEDPRVYSIGFSREEYVFYAEHPHVPVLTDLLDMGEADFLESAKLQSRLRKTLEDAVEDVPIADFQHITPEERRTLRAAIQQAERELELPQEKIDRFEQALTLAIAEWVDDFIAPGPAYAFIQEEDFRWFITYASDFAYTVVRHEDVGSRAVLLLRNGAGRG